MAGAVWQRVPRRRFRPLVFMVVLCLLAALLSPVLHPAEVSASGPGCAPGQAPDPTTGQCAPNQDQPVTPTQLASATTTPSTIPPTQVATIPPTMPATAAPTQLVPVTTQVPLSAVTQAVTPLSIATATAPAGVGRVSVATYLCPPGYDAGSASLNDLTAHCAAPLAGVTFTLTAGGNTTQQATATVNGKSTAAFDGVPAGNLTLQEAIPNGDGTPVVYCLIHPLNKLGIPVTSRIPVSPDGTISGSLPADDELVCAWFNVPQAGTPNATSTATAPAKPTAGLIVQKVNCPPGSDPTTLTLAKIQAICTTAGAGITFTVSDGGGQLATGITKTANPNDHIASVIFAPLPAEPVTIRESIPNGFGQPVAFCGNIVNGQISNIQRMTVTNGAVSWNLNAAAQNICAFADIPTTAGTPTPAPTAFLVIDKTACPPGYDPTSATLAQLKANCTAPLAGVPFTVANGGTQVASGMTQANPNGPAQVIFSKLPTGTSLTVSETIPSGYATPVIYCQLPGAGNPPSQQMTVSPDGSIDLTIPAGQYRTCFWFNIPAPASMVTVHKWQCPQNYDATAPGADPAKDCTHKQVGVTFTLTDAKGSTEQTTATNGTAVWNGVSTGTVTLAESIPNGFGTPLVNCYVTEPQKAGGITNGAVTAPNGVFSTILDPGMSLFCDWYNIPQGPAQITIHKWTCPPNFVIPGGNPKTGCTQATNGITFTATGPNGFSGQEHTGDFGPGIVQWGGFLSGHYTVTEQVPAQTAFVFVSDCTGLSTSAVHPYPLSTGPALSIDVAPGDQIDCNWYNVPASPTGTLTIHKQGCAGAVFTSTLDCQAFTGGQQFILYEQHNGGFPLIAQRTTDAQGLLSFSLDPGTYQIQEQNRTWCAVGAPSLDSAALQVLSQHGTVTITANTTLDVWVYNCGITPAPVTPTAYPNTGAGPMSGPGGPDAALPLALSLLAAALALGAAGMAGLFRSVTIRIPKRVAPAALAGTLLAASVALPLAMNAGAQPLTTTPNSCAATARVLPRDASGPAKAELEANAAGILATAALNPVCHDVPVEITVNAAHIKAKVEVAEIDGGVMQAPTSPQVVAWYKSSPRLGQPGNMLLAGHLNWWGVPQGVFFYLNTLKPGDRIQLTGQDGAIYTYKVRWNKQVDATRPPTRDIVGPTKTSSLTLITCGGPWDASTSEYTQRTVVRAELVSIKPRK